MLFIKKQFCQMGPLFFALSRKKEILKRHLKNRFSKEPLAKTRSAEPLPVTLFASRANMIKRAPGVDLTTQFNKADNINIACQQINGLVIRPGETFSFWRTVGKPSTRRGFKEGRVLELGKLKTGTGGGLCNLSNTIHLAVLSSPLTVTEVHMHSDALAPDTGKRIPMANGTSVSYNYVDFQCKNNTNQSFQLLTHCEGEELICRLCAEQENQFGYRLEERDHHFRKKDGKFYQYAKIYRITVDLATGEALKEDLIWKNRSEVLYDYSLIPQELVAAD